MKNKRNFIKRNRIRIIIGALIITGACIVVFDQYNNEEYKPRVCSGDQCFIVELAKTSAEHQKGLMYRTSMDERNGMLFIFPTSKEYTFRMKNTLIPLDMIWIDDQFRVVKVLTAQPCTADPCPIYNPWSSAKYVLEINAGMAAQHGIQEWTKMIFINVQ